MSTQNQQTNRGVLSEYTKSKIEMTSDVTCVLGASVFFLFMCILSEIDNLMRKKIQK